MGEASLQGFHKVPFSFLVKALRGSANFFSSQGFQKDFPTSNLEVSIGSSGEK